MAARRPGYKEQILLNLLRRWLVELGEGPSYTTLSRELGIARENVAGMVRRLERRGYLRRVGVGQQRRVGWVSDNEV